MNELLGYWKCLYFAIYFCSLQYVSYKTTRKFQLKIKSDPLSPQHNKRKKSTPILQITVSQKNKMLKSYRFKPGVDCISRDGVPQWTRASGRTGLGGSPASVT